MLNATINAKTLKRIVNIVRGTCDEAIFQINADGITITVADHSNAHLADIHAPLEQFRVYEATKHQIGVDIDNLWSKIKSVKATTEVHLSEEIEDNKPIRLLLKIGNSTFGVHLLDVSMLSRIQKLPSVQLSAVVSDIGGSVLKQLVKDSLAIFPKSATPMVVFTTDKHGTFRANAKYNDTYESELANSSRGIGTAKYNLDYLSSIAAGIDDKDIITLSFGDDLPLKINFAIDGCEITQWLAARIERGEEC